MYSMPHGLSSLKRALAAGMCIFTLNVAIAQAQSAATGAVAAVVKLYRDFAWEAVSDDPGLSQLDLFGRSQAEMARYLDSKLIALVMEDRACSRRTQGVCNLDFSPIWDSQDPVGTTVKIKPTSDSNVVAVTLSFRDQNPKSELQYVMTKSPAGWRVRDIRYNSHKSLVQILSEPVR
jgi:hypothetical protein